MSVKAGITEKRLADKRFRKTEETILRFFFMSNRRINIGDVAKKAGVARSTIYNHHRSFWDIRGDYEEYILRQYKRLVRRMMRIENLRAKIIYFRTLYFILANKNVFGILIKIEEGKIFEKMLIEVQTKLIFVMRLPKNSQTLFAVYESEIARLMYEWGKRGFCQDEIEKLLIKIMYLTETARDRLKVLLD